MVSNNELAALIDLAKAHGANVDVHVDVDALYLEGREVITEVRIEGLAGIGPHWMPAIAAAERLREAFKDSAFHRVYSTATPSRDAVLQLAAEDAAHAQQTEWANKLQDARADHAEIIAFVRTTPCRCAPKLTAENYSQPAVQCERCRVLERAGAGK